MCSSDLGGAASITVAPLGGGSHAIRAEYAGDGVSYTAATSVTLTQTVTKATSTPVVADTPNPSTYGATVTFARSAGSGTCSAMWRSAARWAVRRSRKRLCLKPITRVSSFQ